jgi:hypothetical protein
MTKRVNFAGYNIHLPGHPFLRIGLGVVLVIGGIFGFLPVLGFWMIPLGLIVLSVDFPPIRRLRRRATVRFGYWLEKRWPQLARKAGFGHPRSGKHS